MSLQRHCNGILLLIVWIWRQSIVSQLASLYLLLCLQVVIISVLLSKKLPPLYVAISYFSFKHKRQGLLFGLQERHILIIFHVIFGVPLRFLISQNSFDNSVSFLCLLWLNDFLWFPKRYLNVIMYISVGVHIGHTAAANFYIGPVKKLMQFVMRRKMLI